MGSDSTRVFGVLMALMFFCAPPARAHRDDYLNETVVYLTLEKHEIETEYWFDLGNTSGTAGDFTRHNAAIEWGIANSFMVDGRATFVSREHQPTTFDSWRLESRYRFSDEGVLPVDVAVSCEVNAERERSGATDVGIEPRLILSKDVGEKLNFTVNCSEEVPLDSGSAAFLAAFGSRLNWTRFIRVGSEFQYNVQKHTGQAIPQVWLALTPGVTAKFGYARGVDRERSDFARAAVEIEF